MSAVPPGSSAVPDHTAVRVALWRALHVQLDAPPHVLQDELGLRLAAPEPGWQQRPDMDPEGTRQARATTAARARFVEDLVIDRAEHGVQQYVILGAGLDTFAQRRPDVASRLRVFEVDQPATQAWKRQRLLELGFEIPEWLRLVPVDFEAGDSWWEQLPKAGFDPNAPAVVSSLGVSMYLTREANAATMRQLAQRLAPGSAVVMTFILPREMLEPEELPFFDASLNGARRAGTPFVSLFAPEEIVQLAREAGFQTVQHVSARDLAARYFARRTDGLRPGSEELLVATT
jgi:methyltransferase (TIGR00027 family)